MMNRMKTATFIIGAVLVFALVFAMAFALVPNGTPTAYAAANEHTVVWDKATLETFDSDPDSGYTKSIKDPTTNKTITFTLGAAYFERKTDDEEFYDEEWDFWDHREVFKGLHLRNDDKNSLGFTFSIDTSETNVAELTKIEMIGSFWCIYEAGTPGWSGSGSSSLVWTGESATVEFYMDAWIDDVTEIRFTFVTHTLHSLTLNTVGGTINSGDLTQYEEGVGATLPIDVTNGDLIFAGWYDNATFNGEAVTTIGTEATGAKTYWAKWTGTVTLNANGGVINSGNLTQYVKTIGATLPTDVTREEYIFAGWYANAEFDGNAVASITGDATGNKEFWAKWHRPINYNLNGGNIKSGNVTSYEEGVGATLPTNVTREDYIFVGWYATADFEGEAVAAIGTDATGNKEYWAKWNPIITYNNLNGGAINSDYAAYYVEGVGATLPTDVTKAGAIFSGWYDNAGLDGDAVTTIGMDATGAKEYWAKWYYPPVTYVSESWDEDNKVVVDTTESCDLYTVVASNTTSWTNGNWYVVAEDVTVGSRVGVSGTVNLILADGATLTVNGGINVAEGNTLNIYGQTADTGALTVANTATYCAGIGGGDEQSAGTIVIHGGTINATGKNGTGIGGGYDGNGGTVTVYGGTVNAMGNSAAGIGGGYDGNGGTVTIYGGVVNAQGDSYSAGIGGGDQGDAGEVTIYGGYVRATGGTYAGGIGGGHQCNGGTVSIHGGYVVANAGEGAGSHVGIGGSDEASDHGTLTVGEDIIVLTNGNDTTDDLTIRTKNMIVRALVVYMAWNGSVMEENKTANYTLVASDTTTWADGWYVVKEDVTIGSRVTVSGTANLILCDDATLTINGGIGVSKDNTINIYAQDAGTGVLIATANNTNRGAGIGGAGYSGPVHGGTINIHGGKITATGYYNASGIGSGDRGTFDSITIYGGTITATGGNASGIGTGYQDENNPLTPGPITIYGGTITATGSASAGIGAGVNGVGGTVTIHGGTITATAGGVWSAGIGGSYTGAGGDVTVYGGFITATGGSQTVGIGGGGKSSNHHGTLTVADGLAVIGGTTRINKVNNDYARNNKMIVTKLSPVTLNTNGGTIVSGNVTEYPEGTNVTLPTNVTKEGLDFAGWYDNEGFSGDAVTSISSTARGPIAYWAKFIEHNYSDEWSSNGNTHWHVCLNAGCTAKGDEAAHVGEWVTTLEPTCTTAGSKHKICTVCGREFAVEEIEATGHNYATEWTSDETDHWHVCLNANCDAIDGLASHSYSDSMDDGEDYYVCACGYVNNDRKAAYDSAMAVKAVKEKIAAIGTVAYSAESKGKIDDARTAYNALTPDQKALIDAYETLTTAESTYEVKEVIGIINSIGDVEYTDEVKAKIDAAKDKYDALSPEQKQNVTNLGTLTTAESTYEVKEVIAVINAIGDVEYSAEVKAKIDAANAKYKNLSDEQKQSVTNLGTLTTAEDVYDVCEIIAAIGDVEYTEASKEKIDAAREAFDALPAEVQALVPSAGTLTGAEDTYEVKEVIAVISGIGEVGYTTESKALIEKARKAYNELTDEQKAQVGVVETLTEAESDYAEFATAEINDLINIDNVSLEDKEDVLAAKAAYDALSPEEKNSVPAETIDKINAAVKEITDIEESNEATETITALPTENDVKIEDKAAIEAARAAYEELSAEGKAKVSADIKAKLEAAEEVIADIESIVVTKGEGATTYAKEISKEEAETGVSVKQLFKKAASDEDATKEAVIKSGDTTVSFDAAAVNAIGDKDTTYSVKVSEQAVEGAEMQIDLELNGATFAEGAAKVSTKFEKEVPKGKKLVVYHLANGIKTAVRSWLSGGLLTFTTNHFSTYIVVFEDEQTGLSGGAIAGIVIGCFFGLLIIACAVLFLLHKKGIVKLAFIDVVIEKVTSLFKKK